MSKEKLIELVQMDGLHVRQFLDEIGVDELRDMLLQALKEQDRETKDALVVMHEDGLKEQCSWQTLHDRMTEYRDKSLDELCVY